VLIANKVYGKPIPVEHGGPARVIIPKKYAWKGAKFIREITFIDRDISASGKSAATPTTPIPGWNNALPPTIPACLSGLLRTL
jgi:DMSO/TMAO reductase YedYZ molybdopterin-dependent catalytic subunit